MYVSAGDTVAAGDLLYTQDDSELDEQIEEYEQEITTLEEELDDCYEQLAQLSETMAALTVTAPFSGRITRGGRRRGRQRYERRETGRAGGRQPDDPDPVFQLRL